jgi:hypothetical protein
MNCERFDSPEAHDCPSPKDDEIKIREEVTVIASILRSQNLRCAVLTKQWTTQGTD